MQALERKSLFPKVDLAVVTAVKETYLYQDQRPRQSLLDFKYRRIFKAEKGKNGSSRNKKGREGKNLVIHVPFGTVVFEEGNNRPLVEHYGGMRDTHSVARGGRGGRGEMPILSPTHRTPYEFEPSEPGEERRQLFVGRPSSLQTFRIVSLPNAGKSTLISRLTDARPKIGDYPSTTLTPTLGVLRKATTLLSWQIFRVLLKGLLKERA